MFPAARITPAGRLGTDGHRATRDGINIKPMRRITRSRALGDHTVAESKVQNPHRSSQDRSS